MSVETWVVWKEIGASFDATPSILWTMKRTLCMLRGIRHGGVKVECVQAVNGVFLHRLSVTKTNYEILIKTHARNVVDCTGSASHTALELC